IEHEGMPGDALTAAQLQADAKILAWAHKHHPDISMWLTTKPSGSGLAWHGLGGAAWGNHPQCPGKPIVGELPEVLAVAKAILNPLPTWAKAAVADLQAIASALADHTLAGDVAAVIDLIEKNAK